MSFLSKLKERLFKTSSKIKEGVDSLLTQETADENLDSHPEISLENTEEILEKVSNDTSKKIRIENKKETLFSKLKKNVEKIQQN